MSVNWEGGWVGVTSSSISYYTGDVISHNNIVYSVKKNVAVVPIGSPSPDLDMSNWDVFASGANGTSGSSGTSGGNGSSGDSGTSGSSGNSGTSGSSGNSGTSGSSGSSGTSGANGTSGSSGANGTSGSSGTNGTSGSSGSSGNVPVTGSWNLTTGTNSVSFTVTAGQSYVMWVNGNIPNGIVNWNATVTLSNSNVPVIGSQYGWYYLDGNALVLTSIPSQIIGTLGSISTTSPPVTNSNTFTFGITNNSGSSQTVYYGYIKVS